MKIRGVKVHDDTHAVLKRMKAERRKRSIDEVVRELVREATGRSVEQHLASRADRKLTSYLG